MNLGTIWAELGLDLTKFDKNLKSAEAKIKAAEKNLSGFEDIGDRLTSAGKKLSLGITAPITAAVGYAVKASVDLEDAFAGVRKTVDATEAQLAELQQGFVSMAREIPISTKELYGIGEAAGQLGIKTENILGFTEVMAKLGVTTNLSSDAAATALARLSNITQMSQTDFDRLGATLVALGNAGASAETEIVDMSLRLAGAGHQIGMSEAQILGFANALSSVGIEAEAGGSAFSRVMSNTQLAVETGGRDLQNFAAVAGMTAQEFARAFREDAASAIIAFVEGLGRSEERGVSAIKVLDDMGISEIRLRDALLRATGAGDMFRESVDLGNKAWAENTALNKEANERFGTTASKLQLLKNSLTELADSFGQLLLPVLSNLIDNYLRPAVKWFTDLDESTKKTYLTIAGAAAFIGPALLVLGGLAKAIVDIHSAVAIAKPIIEALTGKFLLQGTAGTAAAAGTTAAGTAAATATPFITGLGLAVKFLLNPWTLLIAGCAGLVYALSKIPGSTGDAAKGISNMEKEARTASGTIAGDLIPTLYDAVDAMDNVAAAADRQKVAVGLGVGNQRAKVADQMAEAYRAHKATKEAEDAAEAMRKAFEKATADAAAATWRASDDIKDAIQSVQDKVSNATSLIDTQINIAQSRFELLAASLDPVSDAARILTEKLASQEAQLGLLGTKIEETTAAYEEMKALKGAAAQETLELEAALLKEQKAYADIQAAIAATNEELRKKQLYDQGRPWEAEGRSATDSEIRQLAAMSYIQQQMSGGGTIDPSIIRNVIGMADGGILYEPVLGLGLRSGNRYAFAETGPEAFGGAGNLGKSDAPVTINTTLNIHGSVDRETLQQVRTALNDHARGLVPQLRMRRPGVI